MIKIALSAALVLALLPLSLTAQVFLSGQAGVHFYKSAPTTSQRAENRGRPGFGWEADLFLEGRVSDNAALVGNVRATDEEAINFDYLAIRLTDLTALHLNVQAGKINLPFGNLGERRYPRRNALFSLPLIHEYRTALPAQITTEGAILDGRGRGYGMRLLNLGIYDLGAMLFGSFDIVDYALAVSSGTISSTSYGGGNTNSDLGMVARLAVTPIVGLTIGAAYARGAYLYEPYQAPVRPVDGTPYNQESAGSIDVNTYEQQAAELDVEFSRGHLIVEAEAVLNTWPVPFADRDEDLNVFGYSLEGKYTLMPRLYAALRVGGLQFGKALLGGVEQRWDYNVIEWEGGLGYFLEKDVLLKLVRRETRIQGGSRPKDNLTVLQLALAY